MTAKATGSQYEKYWLLLLRDGKLVIHVPTSLVASIKKAMIKRKHEHRLRTNTVFNKLKVTVEPAKTKLDKVIPNKSQLTFHLHNLQLKDI